MATAEVVLAALDERGFTGVGRPLVVLPETGSTNDDARKAALDGAPHGSTFLADSQTAGRGRQGRPWHSPPGSNLYQSTVLRMALPPALLAPLSLAVGVSVARSADELLGRRAAAIKWPNDVYLEEQKVAGVLIETTAAPGALAPIIIVGIGVNVSTETFPANLSVPATSLALAGAEAHRDDVAAMVLHHLGVVVADYARMGLGSVLEELRTRDFLAGRCLSVDGAEAVGEGIADDGCLLVRDHEGVRKVISGEVTWR